jgi:ABC-2 type transport system permease protein
MRPPAGSAEAPAGRRKRPAGRRRYVHAEWTKLRTAPETLPLLAGVVAGTVGLGAVAASCSGPECGPDGPRLVLTGVQLGQAVVAVLAVRAVGAEYATGRIGVTLAALPRRGRLLAAEAVVVAAAVAAAAVVAVAGSLAVGGLLRPDVAPVIRPAVGSVCYLVLIGLLSLGTATAVRHPGAAVGVVLALLYALPVVTSAVTDPVWHRRLERAGPVTAGLAVQDTVAGGPVGPWTGLGVLALWAAGALLTGAVVLRFRDAGA